jgi:DNA polymerase III gamma/tau subunit
MQLSMIPVILVSNRKIDTNKFIDTLRKANNIPSYHIFSYEPESTIITIDQIREAHNFIVKSQFQKIVVIHHFDTAKSETQNAFLKTLEEHSINTYFVLTCDSADSFLPTIQSRCQVIRLDPNITIKTKDSFLVHKTVEEALDASAHIKKDAYLDNLDSLIVMMHTKINNELVKEKSLDLERYAFSIKSALSLKIMMKEYNIQPEFAFDQLLLDLFKS